MPYPNLGEFGVCRCPPEWGMGIHEREWEEGRADGSKGGGGGGGGGGIP